MMASKFNLLETVIAKMSVPEENVLAGDLGTIVEIYKKPKLAYEVEFVDPDGTTRALLTMSPNQLRKLSSIDILTTRRKP